VKNIIISSNASGNGKTTATLGLIKALIKRGYTVQPYKVGPDYIDSAFHSSIAGIQSRNLDIFLMGENGVKASLSRGKSDYGIIEGVMGLYDGKGIDAEYSTAHVARLLNIPVILVLSPRPQVATLCAEINGLVGFDNIQIAGIILNNVGEDYFKLLKAAIEHNCSVPVFGFLPYDESISLQSRHLGLVQSSEVERLNEKIEICSDRIEKHIDLDEILNCCQAGETFADDYHLPYTGLNISVAYDKAFSFYYKENLELLEEAGKVTYFSPLQDEMLPHNTQFLYLGGGYPEVFLQELSRNRKMLGSIRDVLNDGVRCYAECGGLMYLTDNIDGCSVTGFFNGSACMSNRLQNFGYATLEVTASNVLLPPGLQMNCHEFHNSCVNINEGNIYTVKQSSYDGSVKQWSEGYIKKNTLGTYDHVHFFRNMEFIKALLYGT